MIDVARLIKADADCSRHKNTTLSQFTDGGGPFGSPGIVFLLSQRVLCGTRPQHSLKGNQP